jgi:regulator of RNase E activity RraA
LEQVRAIKYPVFTGATICAHAYCHLLHLGLPVRVGGLVVNQGDLLHGDVNGVTNIPIPIAGEVADVAAEFVAAEATVIHYVQGKTDKTIAGFTERRQEMVRQIERLRQRVSRQRHT